MNWPGMIIGAGLGLAIALLFKCQGGTCPITSNWWIPTIIGAVFGLTWTSGSKQNPSPDEASPLEPEDREQ